MSYSACLSVCKFSKQLRIWLEIHTRVSFWLFAAFFFLSLVQLANTAQLSQPQAWKLLTCHGVMWLICVLLFCKEDAKLSKVFILEFLTILLLWILFEVVFTPRFIIHLSFVFSSALFLQILKKFWPTFRKVLRFPAQVLALFQVWKMASYMYMHVWM